MIAEPSERRGSVVVEQAPTLFGGQPVPRAHADPTDALHATNASRELGAEQSRIGGLVRDASNSGEPQVDGRSRIVSLFQMNPVAEDHGAVER